MRLLPVRPDHVGRGPSGRDAQAHRRRHRFGDERQSLPLRHLSTHPHGDPRSREPAGGMIMLQFRAKKEAVQATRRQFLIAPAAPAAGLAVGYRLIAAEPAIAQAAPAAAQANPFQTYVEITPENRINIHSSQFEMGQGSYFGIATLVMEELDGDWSQVDVIGASGNPALYGNLAWGGVAQGTGGSTSMTSSWE